MGEKYWTTEEERYLENVILPQSDRHSGVHVAGSGRSDWNVMAQEMQDHFDAVLGYRRRIYHTGQLIAHWKQKHSNEARDNHTHWTEVPRTNATTPRSGPPGPPRLQGGNDDSQADNMSVGNHEEDNAMHDEPAFDPRQPDRPWSGTEPIVPHGLDQRVLDDTVVDRWTQTAMTIGPLDNVDIVVSGNGGKYTGPQHHFFSAAGRSARVQGNPARVGTDVQGSGLRLAPVNAQIDHGRVVPTQAQLDAMQRAVQQLMPATTQGQNMSSMPTAGPSHQQEASFGNAPSSTGRPSHGRPQHKHHPVGQSHHSRPQQDRQDDPFRNDPSSAGLPSHGGPQYTSSSRPRNQRPVGQGQFSRPQTGRRDNSSSNDPFAAADASHGGLRPNISSRPSGQRPVGQDHHSGPQPGRQEPGSSRYALQPPSADYRTMSSRQAPRPQREPGNSYGPPSNSRDDRPAIRPLGLNQPTFNTSPGYSYKSQGSTPGSHGSSQYGSSGPRPRKNPQGSSSSPLENKTDNSGSRVPRRLEDIQHDLDAPSRGTQRRLRDNPPVPAFEAAAANKDEEMQETGPAQVNSSADRPIIDLCSDSDPSSPVAGFAADRDEQMQEAEAAGDTNLTDQSMELSSGPAPSPPMAGNNAGDSAPQIDLAGGFSSPVAGNPADEDEKMLEADPTQNTNLVDQPIDITSGPSSLIVGNAAAPEPIVPEKAQTTSVLQLNEGQLSSQVEAPKQPFRPARLPATSTRKAVHNILSAAGNASSEARTGSAARNISNLFKPKFHPKPNQAGQKSTAEQNADDFYDLADATSQPRAAPRAEESFTSLFRGNSAKRKASTNPLDLPGNKRSFGTAIKTSSRTRFEASYNAAAGSSSGTGLDLFADSLPPPAKSAAGEKEDEEAEGESEGKQQGRKSNKGPSDDGEDEDQDPMEN